MADRKTPDRAAADDPNKHVASPDVAESPKTTIRWDEGLKADAEQCAKERGISVAEFIRQSVAHYVAWCAATKRITSTPTADAEDPDNDDEPQR